MSTLLSDFFKKKVAVTQKNPYHMTQAECEKKLAEDETWAPGWEAINRAFEALYPGQEPDHYAPIIPAMFGGDSYLDGKSIYTSPNGYKHFVTYGFTYLYADPEHLSDEENGFGFELTFKLADVEDDGVWVVDLLENLASYVFDSGRVFEPYQFIKGSGESIHIGTESDITAAITVPDTEAQPQWSALGRTEFVQLFGITEKEVEWLMEKNSQDSVRELAERIKKENPHFVTDMSRTKSYV